MAGFPLILRASGADLDGSRVALPVEITHGRSGTTTQPDAPTLSFTWMSDTPPAALGDDIDAVEVIGSEWSADDVQWLDGMVTWTGTRGYLTRFSGYITDLRAEEADGDVILWQVQATGHMARLGWTPVILTRPEETDVARVQAICAAAGVPVTIVGAAGPTLTPDNIDQDALGALHEVCGWSGGLLWQAKDGTLRYGTLHRGDDRSAGRVPSSAVLDGIEWLHNTNSVLNHITITYGQDEPAAHGANPHAITQDTFRDDDSIAQWGYRHADIETKLATQPDALELATWVLARRKQPRWNMPGVVVLRSAATLREWAQVSALDVGTVALLEVENTPGPTPGATTGWVVEGWVETVEPAGWRMQLWLSEDRDNLTRLRPWSEADDQNWTHWAGVTWLNMVLVEEAAA